MPVSPLSAPAVIHADPLGLLVAFGAGMLSFLSPCVLPLVPGYLSMVSGLSAAELARLGTRPAVHGPAPTRVAVGAGGPPSPEPVPPATGAPTGTAGTEGAFVPPGARELARLRARLLTGLLAFVAGFTVVFVALGAASSAVGHVLIVHQGVLRLVSGLVIVAFGAFLVATAAGVRLPVALLGERRLPVRPSALGAWAPPLMGMAFAFAWTPCIGPVLGSVLAVAAARGGTPAGGVALLLAYSLGLGVPFLASGLAFGRLTHALSRVRAHLRTVDLVGGAVLVVFGILLVTGQVAVIAHQLSVWLSDLHLTRLSSS